MLGSLAVLLISQTLSHSPKPLADVPQATIVNVFWKGSLPSGVRSYSNPGDVFIELQHQGTGPFYIPMRGFMDHTDRDFILRPANGPDLHLTAENGTFSRTLNDPGHSEDRTFVGLRLIPNDRSKVRHGTLYTLVPVNGSPSHKWRSNAPVRVWIP